MKSYTCVHCCYNRAKMSSDFDDFVMQVGMLFGYYKDVRFVTNGILKDSRYGGGYYDVYIYGRYGWEKQKIFNGSLFTLIGRGARNRNKKGLMNVQYIAEDKKPQVFEVDGWDRSAYRKKTVLRNGCHSSHYAFQDGRPC